MDNFLVVDKIRPFAEKLAAEKGLELVHVEVIGPKKKPTIRVLIDHENGITHDHCSDISVSLDELLEGEELISSAYILEVSSPGIERGLYSARDFARFSGSRAKVKTNSAIAGQRNFRGVILTVDEDIIHFDDVSNGEVEFSFGDVVSAKLEVDLAKELSGNNKGR